MFRTIFINLIEKKFSSCEITKSASDTKCININFSKKYLMLYTVIYTHIGSNQSKIRLSYGVYNIIGTEIIFCHTANYVKTLLVI